MQASEEMREREFYPENVKVITGRPPNFEEIAAVFPGAHGESVIFAYGDEIYNPSGQELPPELIAHELVHCERQKAMGLKAWWDQYLVDAKFRYEEELLAHKAEYQKLREMYGRRVKKQALEHVASKLAAPLYGFPITKSRAIRDIRGY